ncbi:MAG: hypothetical protein WBX14_08945 [Candidatus Udaeobacter sp.]
MTTMIKLRHQQPWLWHGLLPRLLKHEDGFELTHLAGEFLHDGGG